MLDEDRLSLVVTRWEESHESGIPLSPDELCRDWPEALAEVKRRIHILWRLSPLLDLDNPTVGGGGAPTEPVLPPLPHYEALELLGRGGMGEVYKARDLRLPRYVAVKVLRARTGGPHLAQRFAQEAHLLAQLRHDHIVPIHEAHLEGEQPYFVMEYMAGRSLDRHLDRFRGDGAGTALLLERVAAAVHYAHEQGVLHRDLKPGNILLDEQGKPRVGDFGIAKLLDADDEPPVDLEDTVTERASLTRPHERPGTLNYMAPEQLVADGVVTPRSDVWALGVILHELLTGRRPAEAAGGAGRGVDWRLLAIARRCTAHDPARRFPTAAALATALQQWRLGQPIDGVSDGWVQRLVHRVRTQRLAFLAGAVVPLLVLVAALAYHLRPGPVHSPSPDEVAEQEYRQGIETPVRLLAQQQAADLIDPKATVVPHRWRFGTGKLHYPQGGGVTVTAKVPSLIELMPDPQRDAFCLVVEMRQDETLDYAADLGVYFCHSSYATSAGPQHLVVLAAFADLGQQASVFQDKDGQRRSRFDVGLALLGASAQNPYRFSRLGADPPQARTFYVAEHPGQSPGEWRTLRIEVRPQGVRTAWLNRPVQFDLADWPRLRNSILWDEKELRDQGIDLPARGAIGIYLNASTASIRRFRVEPLAE